MSHRTINNVHVGKDFPLDHNASFNLLGLSDGVGDCPNCHGASYLVSTAIVSGPHDHQPLTGKGRAAVLGKDGWYVGESKTSPCPLCNGDKDELVRLLVDNCNVPILDRTKSFDYYGDAEGTQDMVMGLVRIINDLPECHGLVTLFGPHGTGKTTASQIVVLHACRAGVNAMYITASEIVRGIKDTWNKNDVSEEDYIERLAMPKLLVIDEVDRTHGREAEYVRAVVDMRYRNMDRAMTILITNEDLSRPGQDEYMRTRMKAGPRIPVT